MGGAFGIALGTVWFGESMFTRASDAGNVAHVVLSQKLRAWGFTLIDCQHPSVHMARFGGESWSRARFEAHLAQAMRAPTKVGPWQLDEPWHPGGKTPGRAVESSLPTQ
ncbi:MAG: leucyl/phenylalanyl-tRNA--protein transferase, partial [Myxococcota bacterium]